MFVDRRGVTGFDGDAVSWLNLQATSDLKTLLTRAEIMRRVEPRVA